MKNFWIALAAVFAIAALVFVIQRDFDKAFIAAALGSVSWFLSYRVQIKAMITSVHEETDESNEENDQH